MRKLVVLIGFLPNPRIYKRIRAEQTLFDVELICWDRGSSMLKRPKETNFIAHVIEEKAGSDPIRRLIPLRRFTAKAMAILDSIHPAIIHVQGLDMLQIAVKYQKKHREVKIIYEVADLHRLIVDKQRQIVNQIAQKYLIAQDRNLADKYQLLVITSEAYWDSYFSLFVDEKKKLYMPNVPDLSAFDQYKRDTPHEFTVGYIGGIRYKNQMRNLIEACKRTNVHLLIAGYEQDSNEIETLCQNQDYIEWVGAFDFQESAASLYSRCDVMYSVYDASMANVRVALPNKLYECIRCEIPIIVAKNTYLSHVVGQWGIGEAVDHESIDELVTVIESMRDNEEQYKQYISNCKQQKAMADNTQYNRRLLSRIKGML